MALPYMRHLIFRPVWICLRGQEEVPCWFSFCCQPHWVQDLGGFSTIQTNVGIFFRHYGTGVNFSEWNCSLNKSACEVSVGSLPVDVAPIPPHIKRDSFASSLKGDAAERDIEKAINHGLFGIHE